MSNRRPLVWLHGQIKTPPFTLAARLEAGEFLRRLQDGEKVPLPWSRPMPSIGHGCHELRIVDSNLTWRVIYLIDPFAVVILDVFAKKTRVTPARVIRTCKRRIADYYSDR